MEDYRWLPWSLRQELVQVLEGHYRTADEGCFPPLLPSGVLSLLNEVGPEMGGECLPLIEAMLDDLFHRGIVARIPALSGLHSPWYMCRESAELALRWGTPVILLPLRDGAATTG